MSGPDLERKLYTSRSFHGRMTSRSFFRSVQHFLLKLYLFCQLDEPIPNGVILLDSGVSFTMFVTKQVFCSLSADLIQRKLSQHRYFFISTLINNKIKY